MPESNTPTPPNSPTPGGTSAKRARRPSAPLELDLAVEISPEFEPVAPVELLERAVSETLRSEKVSGHMGVGLAIVDDARIRELNRTYRDIDRETDTLSFGLGAVDMEDFPLDPTAPRELGDIILSYPRAVAQAAEYGCPVEEELAFLTVHSTLHLLGYDHQTAYERRRMRAKEKRVLVRVMPECAETARPEALAGYAEEALSAHGHRYGQCGL